MRLGLAVLMLAAACSPNGGTMIGIVTAVDGNLDAVESFTVLVEGEQVTFRPSPDGDYAFPLSHLHQHLLEGAPVRVGWVREGEDLVAVSISDG